jgi:hypothetical protein
MKINELLNEAMPYGFGSYLKHQIRSNIPFGAAGRAKAAGKSQTGLMANQEFQRFHQWLGSFNGQATWPHLLHFLKARKFKVDALAAEKSAVPKDQVLTDKEVGKAINDLIQKRLSPPTPPVSTTPVAPATTPTAKPKYKMGPDGKPVRIS